ncbi:copper homeostasis protein CutC [Acidicapsa ligni]|uniref:copper homeostasis protein CutC n=1 Tax=Acidicapsa ligni TaxID=542300 RepID=UPI0021DF9F29|nr:copper homeostasis protein CutC [Acidicapsa ligni]
MELEICVDSVESAIVAEKGGADRVELCSDLMEGGITPSSGLIHSVRSKIDIGVFVMIRPRGGDLYYSDSEYVVMIQDIADAKRLGADGVVLGLLTVDGHVDVLRTEKLVRLAAPMHVTFHRAIDMAVDLDQACEDIITTGAHRILTSGGKQTAPLGSQKIAKMVEAAQDRIGIMVGSGLRTNNILEVARATGAQQFHASLRKRVASPVTYHNHVLNMGSRMGEEFQRYIVLEEEVRALRQALDEVAYLSNQDQATR